MAKVGYELGSLALIMMWYIDVTWAKTGLILHLLAQGLARAVGEGQKGGRISEQCAPCIH